jgi:hypothetical protein
MSKIYYINLSETQEKQFKDYAEANDKTMAKILRDLLVSNGIIVDESYVERKRNRTNIIVPAPLPDPTPNEIVYKEVTF